MDNYKTLKRKLLDFSAGRYSRRYPVDYFKSITFFASVVMCLHFFLNGVDNTLVATIEPQNIVRTCDLSQHSLKTTYYLDLQGCNLTLLDRRILEFENLKFLNLGNNNLHSLPPLPASLQVLFLLGNKFDSIPALVSSASLPNLKILSFKANNLTSVPENLPDSILWLILTSNRITSLPDNIGRLFRLRRLALANNLISSLPASMKALTNLELIRLGNNRLETIPTWLMQLPLLSWVGLNDNPALDIVSSNYLSERIAPFDPTGLIVGKKVGEGTSGVVFKAELGEKIVAVKRYKQGCCSSDGLNTAEIRTSLHLQHPNIISIKAVTTLQGKLSVVMDWVDDMEPLGFPPTLQSITRANYSHSRFFSLAFFSRIILDVSRACKYIHENSIMHGDLYAHNLLINPNSGFTKLGDFGAAFSYSKLKTEEIESFDLRGTLNDNWEKNFEKMEVRAFGILLQDLTDRIVDNQVSTYLIIHSLRKIIAECKAVPLFTRPTFAQIHDKLVGILCNDRRINYYCF